MTEIQAEIIAADDARIAAVIGRDRAGLDAIMADDLIYVHSSGAQEDKPTYIERVVSGHYDYKAFEITSRQFRVINDLVFVNGDNKVDIVRDGALKKLGGRYLMVWRKDAPVWRLVTFHAAPIPRAD
jgi:ketosteroid isomerase-like protein